MSYLFLFAGMNLHPNIYDESMILTGAMRVAAGQIPHQDFYALYGPAQFYLIASLFKIFGQSLLVERLYDIFLKALIAAFVYWIVSRYCRKSIAISTTVAVVLWFFALKDTAATAIIPVSLLNLLASSLILPIFSRSLSIKRSLAIGALAGLATLFRYDAGIALFGIEVCLIAIAVFLRANGITNRLRVFASNLWPASVGFASVTLAALAYYLSRASLHSLIFVYTYSSKYYHSGRNMPFPPIKPDQIDNLAVYLPIAIFGISLYLACSYKSQVCNEDASSFENKPLVPEWRGFLITFGLLALVMYLKGWVRFQVLHMYLSILPSMLLLAVLFQHRKSLARSFQIAIKSLVLLSLIAVVFASLRNGVIKLHDQHASVAENLWLAHRGGLPKIQADWCSMKSPSTIGLCFFPDNGHMQAAEFITAHTRPDQKLYVGVTRQDIIFANDNYTYFATQRLPATRWSQFDPLVQNRPEVQSEMIAELEATAPPYIAVDSEFDGAREPNDSSKSSGVTLLDDYIHNKYQRVESFDEMSVWKRMQTP
jgi:hypothetical protein